MMNRRKFLQASAASLMAGLPVWKASNAYAGNLSAPVRGLHFFELDEGCQRTTAAAFHSHLWKIGPTTGGYDVLTMPSLRQTRLVRSQIKELNRPSELVDYARRCHIFVALAHPGDPASMDPALEHCEAAKRAGALTVLLAAEAFPDPDHDQTNQPRIFDRRLHLSGRPQPDAVLNFTTLEPYMEMANVASMFGLCSEIWLNVDLADIRTVLDGKPDAVKLEGGAFGPGRGYRAANEACRYLERGMLAGRPVRGAFIAFAVNPDYPYLDESFAAFDVFQTALHELDCTAVVAWVPARGDAADFLGITALVTV